MRQLELPFCHPNQDQLGTTQRNQSLIVYVQHTLIMPDAWTDRFYLSTGLLPQLALGRLLEALAWLKPTSRRAPVDRHLGVERAERCRVVNVKQEEPLLGIQDKQTYSRVEPPDSFVGLSFMHNVYQNMVLALADCSGMGWSTSQCSTILPLSSRRKMSMPAQSRSPGHCW